MMQAKSLVIVESPSKAKTINKYLGKDYLVTASMGHIKNLPKSKIGIDFENEYKPIYEIIPGKEKTISELKRLSRDANKVLLATDPDREGEAIAFDIASVIKEENPNIYRVLFNEITESGIREGVSNPKTIDEDLVSSQQARRVMDRIVGYKVSPFLWKVIFYGLSAGRVQSVALRLICEREEEIRKFRAVEYWSIIANFKDREKNKVFESKLVEKNGIAYRFNGQDPKIANEADADYIISDLRTKHFLVSDVERKDSRRNPYPPFTTSSLQQDASVRLRFSPKKTMQVAQKLYEGVEIGEEGPVGLITYMRTDSTRLSESAIMEARSYISRKFGKEYVPHSARHYVKKTKGTQDAHEAIRPTSVNRTPESLKKYLHGDLFKLYELIWKRFVACQMHSAVFDQISVLIDSVEKLDNGQKANHYTFRSTASVVKFKGFLLVYEDVSDVKEDEEDIFEIPEDIEKGDLLDLQELFKKQHFTTPPPRYTESSLIKQLDSLGIGRPSTYAMIVSTIINRTYVELRDRKLYATELGETVNRLLINQFPDIFNVKFTARMEEELDRIASGEIQYKEVLDDFYLPFNNDLNELNKRIREIKQSLQEGTDRVCEECGGKMVVKWGRNGRFLSCSNYPRCKNSQPLPHEKEEHEELAEGKYCDRCGAPMVVKSSKYGKFLGCSRYPECKNVKQITLGIKCPKCNEGEFVERIAQRSRKKFYGCSRYPDCDFISNFKPVDLKCDSCGNWFMYERFTKKTGFYWECPQCKQQVVKESLKESETVGS